MNIRFLALSLLINVLVFLLMGNALSGRREYDPISVRRVTEGATVLYSQRPAPIEKKRPDKKVASPVKSSSSKTNIHTGKPSERPAPHSGESRILSGGAPPPLPDLRHRNSPPATPYRGLSLPSALPERNHTGSTSSDPTRNFAGGASQNKETSGAIFDSGREPPQKGDGIPCVSSQGFVPSDVPGGGEGVHSDASGNSPDGQSGEHGKGKEVPHPDSSPSNNTSSERTAYRENTPPESLYPPVPVYAPQPEFPELAIEEEQQGHVELKALVSDEGGVLEVEITCSSGSQELDRAARDTVMTWRFKPARKGGIPVRSWAKLTIRFNLE